MTITEVPVGELEIPAASIAAIRFPKRSSELVVTPYVEQTLVPWKGRMVRESFAPGSFDGIERRANRVRVNRDHDVTRTVGRAVACHPSREVGLVADLKIARTDLGEETLALADEGLLDASAGFAPIPGGVKWEGRSLRRLTKV